MPSTTSLAPPLVFAAVLVLAGCLGSVPGAPASPTATPDPGATPVAADGVDCADTTWVAFWGLSSDPGGAWDPDTLRVGWTLPADQGFFLVAYANGSRVGTAYRHTDGAVTADGDQVPLDRNLSGPHRVRVVLHRDADGDETFDQGSDPPCSGDGELVQAGPQVIDFSRFEHDD